MEGRGLSRDDWQFQNPSNFAARRDHDRGQRWGGACRVEKRSVSHNSALISSELCLNVTTFSSEVDLSLVRRG